GALELEAEDVGPVVADRVGDRPLAGPDLGAGRVVNREPLARGAGRPREKLGAPFRPARDAEPPGAQVVVDLEVDRRELHPQHLIEVLGEEARPPPGLSAEDRRERLPLALIRPLVDDEASLGLRLLIPD